MRHEITPIVCVGESLEIRENGTTNAFVKDQVVKAYQNVTEKESFENCDCL